MKFSAQEEFGLRCMVQMALAAGPEAASESGKSDGASLTIPELAEREALSPAHVAKLMRILRKAGLVQSTRGQNGGYTLARPASEITLDEIFVALGGRLYSGDFCRRHSGKGLVGCVHSIDCSIRSLLSGLDQLLQGVLSQCRLSDLLQGEGSIRDWIQRHVAAQNPAAQAPWMRELAAFGSKI